MFCHMRAQLRHVGEEKGWGVLAGEPVPAGAFIIQYTGEVVTKEVCANRGSSGGKRTAFFQAIT
eukprot:225674-Pelagomonas_calceolata.AAC.3